MLDLACDKDIIQKSGAWFSYNGEKIGQGRENAKRYLIENPAFCEEVTNKIKELMITRAEPAEDEKKEEISE